MQSETIELKIPAHVFNRSAAQTLSHAAEICCGRAHEYHDSWSLENLHTPWLSNLLRAHPRTPVGLDREYKRLIIMASMLDIKLSRLGGPWKEDTAIDSINYMAAYSALREEFERDLQLPKESPTTSSVECPVMTEDQARRLYQAHALRGLGGSLAVNGDYPGGSGLSR